MPRKVASTYLTPQLREFLEFLCYRLGLSEAEILRMCLIDYADKHNLMKEYLHKGFLPTEEKPKNLTEKATSTQV